MHASSDRALTEIAGLVREKDEARFFSAQFAEPHQRARLLAAYAFDLALADVQRASAQPLVCEIKLAWWDEALAELRASGQHRGHPVLQGLQSLPQGGFRYARQMILARRHLVALSAGEASYTLSAGAVGHRLGLVCAIVLGLSPTTRPARQLAAWSAVYALSREPNPASEALAVWRGKARQLGFPTHSQCVGGSAHLALVDSDKPFPMGLALRLRLFASVIRPPRA